MAQSRLKAVPTRNVREAAAPLGRADTSAGATAGLPNTTRTDDSIWDRPGFLVRRLHQIHVAMFLANVAQGEITPIQYGMLSILLQRPNIDQFTIGEELGLDRANVAEILKRLEARKLVARVVDPENRRRKLCVATATGKQFVQRYHAEMQDSQHQLLSPLSANERQVFMKLLSRLVRSNNDSGRTSLRPGGAPLEVGKVHRLRPAVKKSSS